MKWDYWTYLSQPDWFITGLVTKINVETRYQELQNKKENKIRR